MLAQHTTLLLYLVVVVMLGRLSDTAVSLSATIYAVHCEIQFCITSSQVCCRSTGQVLIITHNLNRSG
jgi:hypothetical protein